LFFHEDKDGTSKEVSVYASSWSSRVQLGRSITTDHLPSQLTFKLKDLKDLYRALKKGYSNLDYVLPMRLTDECITITKGPGRTVVVPVVKK
jgi:hypothetical protein